VISASILGAVSKGKKNLGSLGLEVIRGEVVAFAGDRDNLYDQLHLSNDKSFAIE
jgi:hypothetical protein